jgi:hypothetical protein
MQVLCKVHIRGESQVAWRTIPVEEGQSDAGNPGVARPATRPRALSHFRKCCNPEPRLLSQRDPQGAVTVHNTTGSHYFLKCRKRTTRPTCLDADLATKLWGAASAFYRAVLGMGTGLGMGLVLHSMEFESATRSYGTSDGWGWINGETWDCPAPGLGLLADQFQRRHSLARRNESFRTPGDR